MIHTRSLDETVTRYVRNCARTYLEGDQSLRWAVGCIARSGFSPGQVAPILNDLRGYGKPQAWCALERALALTTH